MNGGYDDYYRSANQFTDGWYGRVVNSIPLVNDLADSFSDISKTKDYMNNNGLNWSDIHSYNADKISANSSLNLKGVSSNLSWIDNIGSDLGKLYSQQQQKKEQ